MNNDTKEILGMSNNSNGSPLNLTSAHNFIEAHVLIVQRDKLTFKQLDILINPGSKIAEPSSALIQKLVKIVNSFKLSP